MHQRKVDKSSPLSLTPSIPAADDDDHNFYRPPSGKYNVKSPTYRYYFLVWALGCLCGRFSVLLWPLNWEVSTTPTSISISKIKEIKGIESNITEPTELTENHEASIDISADTSHGLSNIKLDASTGGRGGERWASLSSYYPPPTKRSPLTILAKMQRFEEDLQALDDLRNINLNTLFPKLCKNDVKCIENNKTAKRNLYDKSIEEGYDATTNKGASLTRLTRSPTGRNFGEFQLKVEDQLLSVRQVTIGYELLFQTLHLDLAVNYLGVPIQQNPLDLFAIGDLLWRLQPDLVIELGTGWGGSAFYYEHVMGKYGFNAKILTIDPSMESMASIASEEGRAGNGVQVRKHCPHCIHSTERNEWMNDTFGDNGKVLETGPIRFYRGVPTSEEALFIAKEAASKAETIMVIENSNHDFKTVLENLKLYHQFVTDGSYLLVQNTRSLQPHKAILHFLKSEGGECFDVDKRWEYFVFSQHYDGFLQKRPGCK